MNKTIELLEKERKRMNEEIDRKIAKLKSQMNKLEWIKIKLSTGEIEVERKLHTDMNYTKEIKIPEGCELLELSEFLEIWNNYRDKFDFAGDYPDEVVSQPIKDNKDKYPYWNVWFGYLGGGSGLGGGRDLDCNDWVRGVRFVRKKISGAKKT